ncbi:hypothetical protein ACLOJK_036831 [Asimina triloba]
MDAQVHPLHDEDGTGEEIMGHSSLSNDRSSSEELSHEEKFQKSKMAKQASTKSSSTEQDEFFRVFTDHLYMVRFSIGSVRSDAGIVETFPGIDVLKQKTVAQEKNFGLFYRRKRKLDIKRKHKENSSATSTDRKDLNRFVNHYKRRRVLTPELSTGSCLA